MKVNSSAVINLMLNDCRKAFPILGKVTLCAYVPDFRKKIAHFGQG